MTRFTTSLVSNTLAFVFQHAFSFACHVLLWTFHVRGVGVDYGWHLCSFCQACLHGGFFADWYCKHMLFVLLSCMQGTNILALYVTVHPFLHTIVLVCSPQLCNPFSLFCWEIWRTRCVLQLHVGFAYCRCGPKDHNHPRCNNTWVHCLFVRRHCASILYVPLFLPLNAPIPAPLSVGCHA